jgi:hypothetical protein
MPSLRSVSWASVRNWFKSSPDGESDGPLPGQVEGGADVVAVLQAGLHQVAVGDGEVERSDRHAVDDLLRIDVFFNLLDLDGGPVFA